jgi:hypothetical protein
MSVLPLPRIRLDEGMEATCFSLETEPQTKMGDFTAIYEHARLCIKWDGGSMEIPACKVPQGLASSGFGLKPDKATPFEVMPIRGLVVAELRWEPDHEPKFESETGVQVRLYLIGGSHENGEGDQG